MSSSSRLVLGSCIVAVALLAGVSAIDNGKGIRPPMGWRSWNLVRFTRETREYTTILDFLRKITPDISRSFDQIY